MGSESSLDYYENHSPPQEAERRLGPATSESDRKAPLRDILGILEKQEAWTEESSLPTDEIQEKVESWEDKHRSRLVTASVSTKTIQNRLKELHNRDLVFKTEKGSTNYYWKIKDDDLLPYWQYRLVKSGIIKPVLKIDDRLRNTLYRNLFTRFCVYMSVISAPLYFFSSELWGFDLGSLAAVSAFVFLIFGVIVYPRIISTEAENIMNL